MNIVIRLSKEELEETGMTEDEMEVDIIMRLDDVNDDLPGYNVFIEIEPEVN